MGYIFKIKKFIKILFQLINFLEIVFHIIKLNIKGIYNVSLGKKVYLNNLIKWLNIYNGKKVAILNIKKVLIAIVLL